MKRTSSRRLGTLALGVACATGGGCTSARGKGSDPDAREWVQLFNGRDLTDWAPKFKGHALRVNLNDTFRAEDGLLKVRYDRWSGFGGEFGHLFYTRRPFSYYVVAAEYRFVGEQAANAGPSYAWGIRNNGIMIHSQSPESMGLYQDFPISLEVQLLGGMGDGRERSTANLCTPGTHVVMHDTLTRQHCVSSASRTYHGDQWVRVEAVALGDSVVKHVVNGDTVLTYYKPRVGGEMANDTKSGALVEGRPLTGGWINLQAETAPIDFRKIEVLNLEGCMDPKAGNYKRYYVKARNEECRY